jgi:hypothetical protein
MDENWPANSTLLNGRINMQEFNIIPFVGPSPLRFGMAAAEVTALLGPASWSFRNPAGVLTEERSNLHLNVGYTARDELNEVVFAKGAVLIYEGENLLECTDPVPVLLRRNKGYRWLGSVVFPDIGVLCTRIDEDETECGWTITVAAKGQWDEYKEDFAANVSQPA